MSDVSETRLRPSPTSNPAPAQAGPSHPASPAQPRPTKAGRSSQPTRLSRSVCETGLRPTTSLTCLRLVSSYCLCLAPSHPAPSRLAPLLACLACLRLASGPAQPATHLSTARPARSPAASGPPSPGPRRISGMPAPSRPAGSAQRAGQASQAKLCQLLSLSDVPQPLSPLPSSSAQAGLWPQVIQQPQPLRRSPDTGLKVCQPETGLRPSQPACNPPKHSSAQPAQPKFQAQPAADQLQPTSAQPVPGTWPPPSSQPTSRLSPARQVCLTCLRLASGQRPVSRVTCLRLVKLRQLLSLSDVPQPPGVSRYASLRLASGPVPQPACWRVYWGFFPGYLSKWRFVFPPCTCLGLSNRARNVCHGKPPAT